MATTVVCALSRWVELESYQEIQRPLLKIMEANGVKGSLLLASEGIKGCIAGTRGAIDNVIAWLEMDFRFKNLRIQESFGNSNPFFLPEVNIKTEVN